MKNSSGIRHAKIGQKLRHTTTRVVITAIVITAAPLLLLFSWSYLKNNISQMNIISDQMIRQLNMNASNIISYAYQIPNDTLLLSLLEEEPGAVRNSRIENRLMELCGKGSSIEGIILSCESGNYHSVFIGTEEMNGILNSGWYQELQQREYLRFFSAPDETHDTFNYCTRLDGISSLSGTMIILIRSDNLSQILKNADKIFSHYIWLDNQNNIVKNNQFEEEEYLFSLLNGSEKNNFFGTYSFYNSRGAFISYHSDITRWKFAAFIPYSELLHPFLPIFFVLIVSMVLIIAISSIVLKPLIQNIVAPIEILSEHMRKFSYASPCLAKISTGDEIEELSNAFNDMSLELKKQIEMLLAEQKKEQKMKYSLHISQINPHFIYNTMNTINYLARKNRSEDIVIINNALIHIMKDCLRINEFSVFDTLETEIKVTAQYLTIQEYRYEEKIRILWDIAPDTLSCQIPKHMIQPIVENAIIHGFLDDGFESLDGEPPFIKIHASFQESENKLIIMIEDNGTGIDMKKYETICKEAEYFDAANEYARGKHIGLANIKYRLFYLMGERQELNLCPRLPHGTTVIIRLSLD